MHDRSPSRRRTHSQRHTFARRCCRDRCCRDHVSVRSNLTYSSYGIRGWEYKFAPPRCDCSKRQRSKDYQPQKRVTLVLRKPSSCFSKLLSEGQCQGLRTTAAGNGGLAFLFYGKGNRRYFELMTPELQIKAPPLSWPSGSSTGQCQKLQSFSSGSM